MKAEANYEEMERLAGDVGDEAMLLDALSRQATIHAIGTVQLDGRRSEALIDRALEIALRRGDKRIEARLKWTQAHVASSTARIELAMRSAEEAVAIARGFDLKEELAYALNILARVENQIGRPDAAGAHWDEAAGLFDALRNAPMLADTRTMVASLKVTTGDYDGALAAASDAYRLSEEIHNPWGQGMSRFTTATVEWERGDYGGAIRSLEEAVNFANAAKAVYVVVVQLWLAMVRLASGDQETALTLLGAGAALASKVAADSVPPLVMVALAHAAVLRGDLNEARRLGTEASAFDTRAHPSVGPLIAFASAEIALASGEYASAAQIAHDALDGPASRRLLILDTDFKWIEGDALLRSGDLPGASTALERARASAERLGSQRTMWLILWSQARLAEAKGRASEGAELRRRARAIVGAIAESLAPLGPSESFRRTPEARALLAEA
jgi:tetratricopeptide (TPR) repeat protein